MATPPPTQCGARIEPWRARPVPFWRHGLAPPPRTLPRVLVECVPWRRAASSARTESCTSGSWNSAPNAASSRSTFLVPPRTGAWLAIGPHLHHAVARPGDRAAHEQQVVALADVDDGQPALGHALGAHVPRAADALEHARGRRRGADRAGGAHVGRAVALGAAAEVVALDRALEALALGLARDLDGLADLEGLDGHGVAHRELADLVAELLDRAQRRGVRLLEVAELALAQRLLAYGVEPELDRLVAVDVLGADADHRARA